MQIDSYQDPGFNVWWGEMECPDPYEYDDEDVILRASAQVKPRLRVKKSRLDKQD